MAEAYRSIAHVEKTHGRKGEVVVVPARGLPLLLREGLRVVVVPPRLKGPREFEVLRCSDSANGQLVSLAGVTTIQAASGLVGRTVLARVADLPEDLCLHDVESLLGRSVCDERLGELGTIAEVMRGPANDVWVVTGRYGEVLVPVVAHVVSHVAPDASPIDVSLPGGLVETDVEA
ncbi:MAG: 16S rRNA processing protein RimM [Coriobacteriales bacterium]|nr:16S rRNA processing protein RimM [Coriobacteriales bacterium]